MADISKLKTPDGTTYSLKDETARAGLAGKAAAEHTHAKSEVGLDKVDNTSDSNKNVFSAKKMQTYKKDSTTETYGINYPLYAQWETNDILKLKCDNYTVKTDYSISAGNSDTVDGYHVDNLIYLGDESVPPVYFTDIARINNDKKTIESWDTGTLEVGFAKRATNADTVDGKHASDFAAADHTHSTATQSANGLMSADDKAKLDGLSKITVEHFDATTDEWSHVSLFATGGKIPIAAVFSYNTVMYSIFVYNGYYYISVYDTSMNAIPNAAVSFDLICKEG